LTGTDIKISPMKFDAQDQYLYATASLYDPVSGDALTVIIMKFDSLTTNAAWITELTSTMHIFSAYSFTNTGSFLYTGNIDTMSGGLTIHKFDVSTGRFIKSALITTPYSESNFCTIKRIIARSQVGYNNKISMCSNIYDPINV
jgi:hypothetical protein